MRFCYAINLKECLIMVGYPKIYIVYVTVMLVCISCTNDIREYTPLPVSEQTMSLEAAYTTQALGSISAAYWNTADYVVIPVENVLTKQADDTDGLLNVNGMYNGLGDFNRGDDALLVVKAAYDDVNLYMLFSWQDRDYNVSQSNWLFNGPEDPLKSGENRFGWTSQRNDDNLIVSFENGSGERDIWKWSLALSEPVGYAIDMHGSDPSWTPDAGKTAFVRNIKDEGDARSGPKYQWDGQDQEVNRSLGGSTFLDPGFYLLKPTDFTGDILEGESTYKVACGFCHGMGGDGNGAFQNSNVPLNVPGWLNRYTQQQLDNVIGNTETHRGARYWNGLSSEEQVNLGARLRAFAGIPGYLLQTPGGSSADVRSESNVLLSRIDYEADNVGYKLLLIRKLKTGNDDDVQFNSTSGSVYNFNIYLTDDDNLNLVGKMDNQLKFVK